MLAEPTAAIGAQRRRMHRFQNQIPRLVNHIRLATCETAPKHIDEVLALRGQRANGRISKSLPTQLRVAVGLMGAHGERGVEQQNALLGPARQVARRGDGRAEVVVDFLENVL